VPGLPSSILEPLWVQVSALLPTRQIDHPLGCHRPRIPDRIIFDKLIQIPGVRLWLSPHRRPHLLGDHAAPPPRRMEAELMPFVLANALHFGQGEAAGRPSGPVTGVGAWKSPAGPSRRGGRRRFHVEQETIHEGIHTSSPLDGEQPPFVGNALQGMQTAIDEGDLGPDYEVFDCSRD
jgi:hypothetical protein